MPYYRFEIESPLSKQRVIEKIQAQTRSIPNFFQEVVESYGYRPPGAPTFIGVIEGNEFSLIRDIHYGNAFLPRVYGELTDTSSGTNVRVTMLLHRKVIGVFMFFWLTLAAIGAINALMQLLTSSGGSLEVIGFFIISSVFSFGAFYFEAFKARRLLERSICA